MRLLYPTLNIDNITVLFIFFLKKRDQSEKDAKALQGHWQSRVGQRQVLLL